MSNSQKISLSHLLGALVLVGTLPLLATDQAAAADPLDDLRNVGARVALHKQTGKVNFIGSGPTGALNVPGVVRASRPEDSVFAVLKVYGPYFGLNAPAQEMKATRSSAGQNGRFTARYQQLYQSIPVLAGELVVNLDRERKLLSLSGELSPDLAIGTTPEVSTDVARAAAIAGAKEWYSQIDTPKTTEPELWIYDPQLLEPSTVPARLVWRLEVTAQGLEPVRELVLIDAQTGEVALHINQIAHARNRQTYTANGGTSLPGSIVCYETTNCTGSDTDVTNAHRYAGDTYNFYWNYHRRDSLNNAGLTLRSTANYSVNYQNAFWNGSQMVYGDNFPVDDVVGHELTHGVTQYESNLVYSYESGAINESFSDVWGELIDLTNGSGNDSSSVRWLVGEDLPIGAIRSMSNPPAYGDPDRIGSSYYYRGSGDSGGVHINSGVSNKAAYLLTDGGSFNGYSVYSLGVSKVAKIYYEAQTNLLTSGSGYGDLYNDLWQGCINLYNTGAGGITSNDCTQVDYVTIATEMYRGY